MRTPLRTLGTIFCLALVGVACRPSPPAAVAAPTAKAAPALRFDVGAIDLRADPCTDFYDYACGSWRATHPIPADQTRWSRYSEMVAANRDRERSIVEESARAGPTATPAEQRVGAYYAACMDEAGIAARGLAPVQDQLAAIDRIRSARDAADVIANLHAHGVEAVFSAYPGVEPRDANRRVLWIDSGKLGLPDPADYAKSDDDAVTLRARYVDYLERLLALVVAPGEARKAAERVLALETALAANALSRRERRQIEKVDNPMTVAGLSARFPVLDWPSYFAKLGVPSVGHVDVAQPAWLDGVNQMLGASDLAGLRDYLRVQTLRPLAAVLPAAIEAVVFDFQQRTLRGAKEMPPRWKRCLSLVDDELGEDVGRVFVARHFDADARARVDEIIRAVRSSFEHDLATSEWLGAPARAAALDKLSTSLIVTGQSHRPRSFEGLAITPGDAYGNTWRAQAQDTKAALAALRSPVDREEFFTALPQQLDAFGSKPLNATGFTAGYLQPPVFDAGVDRAVNFGAFGSVVGHELSHQFDDEGRKYDARGNLRSWWSPDDIARFEERAQCFVDEYGRFKSDDGSPLDGKLTLGENIADNGGARLSYRALAPAEGPRLDGFTPAQRFFLAWGQIRCENVTLETAKRLATSDQHAPGRWRVNGVVANMPEFAAAFSCRAGSPMAPANRCVVW